MLLKKTIKFISILLSLVIMFNITCPVAYAGESGAKEVDETEDTDVQESEKPDEDVVVRTGWFKDENGTRYYDESGESVKGWMQLNNKWYYFNEETGYMTTGWQFVNEKWYYMNNSGVMETGWIQVDGKWYYMNEYGMMQLGWNYIGGRWYHMNEYGMMELGWNYIDGKWYHMNEYGMVDLGWNCIDGKWYYMDEYGIMQVHWNYICDKWYYMDDSGAMQTGWIMLNGTWFYLRDDGSWDESKSFSISTIESKVKSAVSKYSGSIGVYFEDLTTGESFTINDKSMYPCSIIKMATMATVFDEINKDNLTYNKCKDDLWNMMVHSDNTAYNRLMSKIGQGSAATGSSKVNKFLKDNGIERTAANNGLLPGDGYFSTGGKNTTCPSDIGKLLSLIYNKSIVNPDACDSMISLMSCCADNSALRKGVPSGVTLAHKSGWAYDYYHDGGIVYADHRDYILVVFTQSVSNYGTVFKDLSSLVYQYENSVY